MAIAQTNITNEEWFLVGDNVSSITFQCLSSMPIQIAITSSSTAPPLDSYGLVYNRFEGELKTDLTELSYENSPAYVWAKPLSSSSSIIYETP